MRKSLSCLSVIGAVFVPLLLSCPSHGQTKREPSSPASGTKQVKNATLLKSMQTHPQIPTGQMKLDKPVEVPGIPMPGSGAKYKYGFSQAGKGGGQAYAMRFGMRESKSQVTQYYKTAMLHGGYDVRNTSNESRIRGKAKDGSFCTIDVLDTREPGFGCDIYINYSAKK